MYEPYNWAVLSIAFMGFLVLVQHFIAAVGKNVVEKDNTAGVPINKGHDSISFRFERAHANTLENLVPFFLVFSIAMWLRVSPFWVNTLALVFLGARSVHMVVYYAGIAPVRTLAFLVGYLSMAAVSIMTLLKLPRLF